ncbi:alcohol dehydrogenase catalytic domain-containing protein [Pectinatus brassicae]|uniref:Threonine dehydrogenase-like Zn-dependent dehydrogenase n=1 Tax=Pectinatus brassicae TaxID=862415 RepID=A0A840UII4_9FIRM|nr:alcohol dehydrogenase catalytic domain-containing protein [Pectinatus brassicae]MBB5335387.1 threonine dehydrogenase-like Zn-dependent dehydrogenase [Pectinatus brassicae]
MKAVIFNSTQGIIKKEIPLPAMKNNELLLKVQTCGICSSDIKTLTHAREAIQSPIILGHEFTGEIVDISTDNDNFTIGQRVVVSPTIGCGQCYFCKTGNQHHCIHKKNLLVIIMVVLLNMLKFLLQQSLTGTLILFQNLSII